MHLSLFGGRLGFVWRLDVGELSQNPGGREYVAHCAFDTYGVTLGRLGFGVMVKRDRKA